MMMMIDVFNLMFFECSTIDMVWLTYKVEHILQRVEPSDPLKTCHYIMDWFANNMDILRGCNVNICWHKVTVGYHKVSDLHQGNRWPSLGCKRFAAGVSPFSDTPIASRLFFFCWLGPLWINPGIGGERLQTLLQTDVVLALGSSEVRLRGCCFGKWPFGWAGWLH